MDDPATLRKAVAGSDVVFAVTNCECNIERNQTLVLAKSGESERTW